MTPERLLKALHTVPRNSFVRFSSLPITADYFGFIVANTTNTVGFS